MRPQNPFRRIMRTEDPSPAMLSTDAESVSCGDERARIDDVSDAELVQRFVYERDQAAFTCIVERYSRLVLGVALRHLRDRNRAEDAFQATFLVLAENARKIRKRKSLASWLHGVARRVALRTMSEVKRETTWEAAMEPASDMLDGVVQAFEQQALDKELAQLPEKYRDPLTLHYLEGLSHAEIGERLGLSPAAVHARLKRGRTDLRLRLVRRGVSLSVAAGVFHLSQQAVQAATFPTLVSSTSVAAQSWVAGTAVSSCTPNAVLLAGKEIAVMAAAKTTMVLSITGAVCLAAGIVIAAGQGGGSGDGEGNRVDPGTAAAVSVDGANDDSGELIVELVQGEAAGTAGSGAVEGGSGDEESDEAEAAGTSESESSEIDVLGETDSGAVVDGEDTDFAAERAEYEARIAELEAEIASWIADTRRAQSEKEELRDRIARLEHEAEIRDQVDATLEHRYHQVQNLPPEAVVTLVQAMFPGIDISIDSQSDSVIVAANAETQANIRSLLERVDKAPNAADILTADAGSTSAEMQGMPSIGGATAPGSIDYSQVSEGRRLIETAFRQLTQVQFQNMPVSQALDYIAEIHQIPIRIDEAALAEEGVTPDDEITYLISGLTVQDALDVMLEDVAGTQLSYIVKNDILTITTAQRAMMHMETRVYEMRHFQGLNPSIAMELIRETTEGPWQDGDMPGGTIVPIEGGLVIRQNQGAHREIHALLEQIQQFNEAGLETPSDWLDVEGSGYDDGSLGNGEGVNSDSGIIGNPETGFDSDGAEGGGLGTGTPFDAGEGASTGSPDTLDSSSGDIDGNVEADEFDSGEAIIPGGPNAIGP